MESNSRLCVSFANKYLYSKTKTAQLYTQGLQQKPRSLYTFWDWNLY